MFPRLASIAEFERALAETNLMVFVFAAWSQPCFQSRDALADALRCLGGPATSPELAIVELDVTEQAGDLWEYVVDWLTLQPGMDPVRFMDSGAGSVAWVRHGLLVDWVVSARHTGTQELVERSLLAFSRPIQDAQWPLY